MNYPAIRQCPVCGKYSFEVEFEECPICSWMNDVTQEENPDAKGPVSYTHLSLLTVLKLEIHRPNQEFIDLEGERAAENRKRSSLESEKS